MAKRKSRVKPIDHERRQLENLKILTPSTTPERHHALSDSLVDVAIVALEIVRALEVGAVPDFERLYDLVDGLEDTIPAH